MLIDDEGRHTVDRSDKAYILSDYFESVFVKDSVLFHNLKKEPILACIERVLNKINEYEIDKRLKTLNLIKSMEPDQIHPIILES